jgi:hypothetical protein
MPEAAHHNRFIVKLIQHRIEASHRQQFVYSWGDVQQLQATIPRVEDIPFALHPPSCWTLR